MGILEVLQTSWCTFTIRTKISVTDFKVVVFLTERTKSSGADFSGCFGGVVDFRVRTAGVIGFNGCFRSDRKSLFSLFCLGDGADFRVCVLRERTKISDLDFSSCFGDVADFRTRFGENGQRSVMWTSVAVLEC